MVRTFLVVALALSPTATLAQPAQTAAPLSLEHRMLLRCSAAFAMVSFGQDNGNAEALHYPRYEAAYREFFVVASARVMDEAGMDREQVSDALSREAQDLIDSDTLDQVMPPCLDLLQRQ